MDHLDPILMPSSYDHQSEVADALIGFYDPVDIRIDSLFGTPSTTDLLLNDVITETSNSINLFPCYSEPSILTLPASDNYYRCPKRPLSCSDLYRPFGHSSVGSTMMSGWQSTDFVDFPSQTTEGCVDVGGGKKGGSSGGGYLSVQSVAARERRKRISTKTQELGRLVPGGNKMNTAEMFQAAFKYIKFLQAQVGILGVMPTSQVSKSVLEVEEQTQVLVTSPAIQEKLYSEGKCIVSKGVVEALLEETEIKSIPVISRDLDRLISATQPNPTQPVG